MSDSLITNHALTFFYRHAADKGTEGFSMNLWRHILLANFPVEHNYLVCPNRELNRPDGVDVDLTIRRIDYAHEEEFMLLVQMVRRGDDGEFLVREAKDTLRAAAESILQDDQYNDTVFGITIWGTTAQCWKFQRGLHDVSKTIPIGNGEKGDHRDEYIDARSPNVHFIKEFFSLIRENEAMAEAPPETA